ncbi:MAG: NTP transferase domain-containing protein [Pedobacter sp.]|nr:NTP transferase domain-containing protein [Pedobacter sp.]
MLGIVLCGGQSLRMGADKGLLSHQGKLWAKLASDKFESVKLTVKFSVNPYQEEKYVNHFEKTKLIIDHPSLNLKGPLLGVLSVHLANPDKDLFLLACDLLLMESRILEKLIEAQASNHSFEAYIFKKDDYQEPLCGIYTTAGLKKILNILELGKLTKHSMKFILSNLNVCEINVEDKDYHCFENFNYQVEINGL